VPLTEFFKGSGTELQRPPDHSMNIFLMYIIYKALWRIKRCAYHSRFPESAYSSGESRTTTKNSKICSMVKVSLSHFQTTGSKGSSGNRGGLEKTCRRRLF
jgi:hypothetical protein